VGDATGDHVVEMRSAEKLVSVLLSTDRDCSPFLLGSDDRSVTLFEVGGVADFRTLAFVAIAIDFALPHDSSISVTTTLSFGRPAGGNALVEGVLVDVERKVL